jgi:hypothetical protein
MKLFALIWDWIFPYRMDPRNPARRWCKHCGQQQDMYSYDCFNSSTTWWENMRKVERDCSRFGDHSENGL